MNLSHEETAFLLKLLDGTTGLDVPSARMVLSIIDKLKAAQPNGEPNADLQS